MHSSGFSSFFRLKLLLVLAACWEGSNSFGGRMQSRIVTLFGCAVELSEPEQAFHAMLSGLEELLLAEASVAAEGASPSARFP